MEPRLTLRQAEPKHKDDPIPFPGSENSTARRWQPRLARPGDDSVIRGVESTLDAMEEKLRRLRLLAGEDHDPDRPRAA